MKNQQNYFDNCYAYFEFKHLLTSSHYKRCFHCAQKELFYILAGELERMEVIIVWDLNIVCQNLDPLHWKRFK